MNDNESLIPPPGVEDEIDRELQRQGQRVPKTIDVSAPAPLAKRASDDFRGVGQIHKRNPVAAVVEILHRGISDPASKKMQHYSPFEKNKPAGCERAFSIMNVVCTKQGAYGPVREPHPVFDAFNNLPAEKARTLRVKIVNWLEIDAYQKFLGAYKSPDEKQMPSPPQGYWCKGDGVNAQRFIKGKMKAIGCPNRMCEYSLEGSGPRGQGAHCKPHLELIGQFNWPEGNTLPRILFEFDSQSWNTVANLEAMFEQIRGILRNLRIDPDTFPMVNLKFTMTMTMTSKKPKPGTNTPGRIFPEVHFSIDEDIMDFIQRNGRLMNSADAPALVATQPKALGMMPPDGYTHEQMNEAQQNYLNPRHYKPANERDEKQP